MKDTEIESGPRLTIVGGQPSPGRPDGDAAPVPGGIKRILRRATEDEQFKSRLLGDRATCLAGSGVRLTASERAALLAVPSASLEAMIATMGS